MYAAWSNTVAVSVVLSHGHCGFCWAFSATQAVISPVVQVARLPLARIIVMVAMVAGLRVLWSSCAPLRTRLLPSTSRTCSASRRPASLASLIDEKRELVCGYVKCGHGLRSRSPWFDSCRFDGKSPGVDFWEPCTQVQGRGVMSTGTWPSCGELTILGGMLVFYPHFHPLLLLGSGSRDILRFFQGLGMVVDRLTRSATYVEPRAVAHFVQTVPAADGVIRV